MHPPRACEALRNGHGHAFAMGLKSQSRETPRRGGVLVQYPKTHPIRGDFKKRKRRRHSPQTFCPSPPVASLRVSDCDFVLRLHPTLPSGATRAIRFPGTAECLFWWTSQTGGVSPLGFLSKPTRKGCPQKDTQLGEGGRHKPHAEQKVLLRTFRGNKSPSDFRVKSASGAGPQVVGHGIVHLNPRPLLRSRGITSVVKKSRSLTMARGEKSKRAALHPQESVSEHVSEASGASPCVLEWTC